MSVNLRRRLLANVLSFVVVVTLVLPPGLVLSAAQPESSSTLAVPQPIRHRWSVLGARWAASWENLASLLSWSATLTATATVAVTPTLTPTLTTTLVPTVVPTAPLSADEPSTEAPTGDVPITPTPTVTPTATVVPTESLTAEVPLTPTLSSPPVAEITLPVSTEVPPFEELPVAATITTTLRVEGGRVATPDGRVTLDLPDGALTAATEVRLVVSRPTTPRPGAQRPLWLALDVVPVDPLWDATAHLRFARPVTLTLDLTGFPAWLYPYLVHQTDEVRDTWEVVPSRYDEATRLLTAQIDSFSEVGVDGAMKFPDDGTHHLLTNLPAVSEFSGAANYSYQFMVPPGRQGMAPSLSLNYSSGALNGLMGTVQSNYVGRGGV